MSRVAAVVILYKPNVAEVEANLRCIDDQVEHIYIVDNSGHSYSFLADGLEATYIGLVENMGVAAAQNVGLKAAISNDFEQCLILDQDSSLPTGYVAKASRWLTESKGSHNKLAAVGPTVRCAYSNTLLVPRSQQIISACGELISVKQIIASGMLIDLYSLGIVGFKDERLFIDGVDHEWCWRALSMNYHVAFISDLKMTHRLGEARRSFLGMTYRVGTPVRLYYQFRNGFLLLRRSYVPVYWKLRFLVSLPIKMLLNCAFEAPRLTRAKYMLMGLRDGVLGISGKLREGQ